MSTLSSFFTCFLVILYKKFSSILLSLLPKRRRIPLLYTMISTFFPAFVCLSCRYHPLKSRLPMHFLWFTELIGKFTRNYVAFYHPDLLNIILWNLSGLLPSNVLCLAVFPSMSSIRILQAIVPSSLALKESEVIEGILFSRMELS